MKKKYLILAFTCLLFGICGCGINLGLTKKDRMMTYINEKYTDDHFEYVNVTGGHLGSNVKKIRVRSEKYPEKPVIVSCAEVDDKEYFYDSYLSIKFEKETYEYIEDELKKEFGDNIYIRYEADTFLSEENGSSDTTFEEFIFDPKTYIRFNAAVISNNFDEDYLFEKIKIAFANVQIGADIFFIDTDENLSEVASTYISNGAYQKCLFVVKENQSDYSVIDWSDGVLEDESSENESEGRKADFI